MSRIGVLVVDDSVVARRVVSTVLGEDPDIDVLGTAADGSVALKKLDLLAPDIITLDLEMPVLDGLATLRRIRETRPQLPVVIFSNLTERGAVATLDALSMGASDYVTKPSGMRSADEAREAIRAQLVPKIKALCEPRRMPSPRAAAASSPPRPATLRPRSRVDAVVIGSSTGGPEALERILPALPADLPVPVIVVQHMPPMFTSLMARRLDRLSAIDVLEAVDGAPVRPGQVLIAPGEHHLVLERRGTTVVSRLTDDPPEHYCRPAVDPLFRSAATVYGPGTLAVVLTGMGRDGRRGAEAVRAGHGQVIAQDAATSTVWGMPGAVVEAGLADVVLPVGRVAEAVVAAVARRRAGFTGGPRVAGGRS